MLRRSGTIDKFVDASPAMDAALDNVDDGFVAKKAAAFRVRDGASVEEKDGIGGRRVDVERAGLAGLSEHLEHTGKIVMGEAATEAGISLGEHLRGLEALGFADDDVANVRGDNRRLAKVSRCDRNRRASATL